MNFRMWQNPATIDAVDKLRNMGRVVLDPEEGSLASLHEGEGRMPDLKIIMNSIRSLFKIPLPLKRKLIGPENGLIKIVR